jgi:hypothetical protein
MLCIFQTFIDSWQRELTSPPIGAGSPLRAQHLICTQHYSALSRRSLTYSSNFENQTLAHLHYRDGAPGRTRTNTSVRKPDFESGA